MPDRHSHNSSGKRGQTSIEFLAIAGIALVVLTAASAVYISSARINSQNAAASQLANIGHELRLKAEELSRLGPGNWATLDINLPETMTDAGIMGEQDVYFSYTAVGGTAQEVVFMRGIRISNGLDNCTDRCSLYLDSGVNKIRIEPNGTHTIIRRTG